MGKADHHKLGTMIEPLVPPPKQRHRRTRCNLLGRRSLGLSQSPADLQMTGGFPLLSTAVAKLVSVDGRVEMWRGGLGAAYL